MEYKKIFTVLFLISSLVFISSNSVAQSCGNTKVFYNGSDSSPIDYSGCGNNGTFNGAPSFGSDYWDFDGTDDRALTDNSIDTGNTTFKAKINTTDTEDFAGIMAHDTGANNYLQMVLDSGGKLKAQIKGSGGNIYTVKSSTDISDGNIHTVAATAWTNNNTITLYVDGQEDTGTVVSNNNPSYSGSNDPVYIGTERTASGFAEIDVYNAKVINGSLSDDDANISKADFNNFTPPDNSDYKFNEKETFSVNVSLDSSQYNTVDVEGIFDGNIEKVKNITANGTEYNVSFNKTFSNTGTFNYQFNLISNSPSGNPIDSTQVRSLDVNVDSPELNLNSPKDGANLYRPTTQAPYDVNFKFNFTTSEDEANNVSLYIVRPNGTTINPFFTGQPSNITITEDSTYQVGNNLGTYHWYLNATGQSTGDKFTSANKSFTINKEDATIDIIKPANSKVDGFEDGDYTNNPSWSVIDSTDQSLNVVQSPVFEGNNSLKVSSKDTNAEDIPSANLDTNLTIKNRKLSFAGYIDSASPKFKLNDGTGGVNNNENSIRFGLTLNNNAKIRTYDSNGTAINTKTISGLNSSTWYKNVIDVDSKNNQIEYRVLDNNGNLEGSTTIDYSGKDKFKEIVLELESDSLSEETAYYDNIEYQSGREDAYLESVPYEVDVTANTQNDQQATADLFFQGSSFKTFTFTGDGNEESLTATKSVSTTLYDKEVLVRVLGSDNNQIASTSPFNVSVVQKPSFSLVDPSDNSTVILEESKTDTDNQTAEDTTSFKGEIEVGESGTGIIQLKKPNGSYQDIITRSFTRSDVNNTLEISGSTLIDNITITKNVNKNRYESDLYNWRLSFNGSDSNQDFTGNTKNSYKYVTVQNTLISNTIQFVGNLWGEILNQTNDTGKAFIAILIILSLTAIGYYFADQLGAVFGGSLGLMFSVIAGQQATGSGLLPGWVALAIVVFVGVAGSLLSSRVVDN